MPPTASGRRAGKRREHREGEDPRPAAEQERDRDRCDRHARDRQRDGGLVGAGRDLGAEHGAADADEDEPGDPDARS